jgi:hypothetical protein
VIPSGNGSGEDEDCVFVAKAKGEWNGVDDKKHAVRSSNRDICLFCDGHLRELWCGFLIVYHGSLVIDAFLLCLLGLAGWSLKFRHMITLAACG